MVIHEKHATAEFLRACVTPALSQGFILLPWGQASWARDNRGVSPQGCSSSFALRECGSCVLVFFFWHGVVWSGAVGSAMQIGAGMFLPTAFFVHHSWAPTFQFAMRQ
jgi:hypothetical protein